jgi:hypothetical protein
VGSALEAVEKKDIFKAHKDSNESYVKQCDVVKQAKAHLAKLDVTTSEGHNLPKSPPRSQSKLLLWPVKLTQPCKLNTCLTSNRQAAEKAKAKGEQAAVDMFQLYTNLLLIDTK